MTEAITDYLVGLFQGAIPKELIIFIISMFPVVELRGGMIAAKLLDVELLKAFVICYLGNILPIPFILLFIRRIFQFLKKFKKIGGVIEKLEIRSMRKSEKVKRWRNWGLLAFVAIPLPGTGGWTGALIAALLDIRIRNSFPVIALGVLIANLIMSIFSYGLLGLIGL
ncbi:MAG: small multi-drug export protein [Clostridia bacterium]|nr:small multi-drug export protein [Clostridia bacterium]MBR3818973.1 small multi-drug export protein [Clostridia bacterium]